jgi:hypothetical protein
MTTRVRQILIGCGSVGLLCIALYLGWSSQLVLELGLPPKQIVANRVEGLLYAQRHVEILGGSVVAVCGTGSMAPYIRKGDKPSDIVAYGLIGSTTFAEVKRGTVCIYAYGDIVAIHGAAAKSGEGWIMSGLHNSRSDILMDAKNFRGIVSKVIVW